MKKDKHERFKRRLLQFRRRFNRFLFSKHALFLEKSKFYSNSRNAFSRLGVDVIEEGFPSASQGDFESDKAVAKQDNGPIVCGLAQCLDSETESAWVEVSFTARPRHCDDFEFSPEDASPTEPEFLAEVVEAAIEAGASPMP